MQTILYGDQWAAMQRLKNHLFAAGETVCVKTPHTMEEAVSLLEEQRTDCLVAFGGSGSELLRRLLDASPAATPAILYLANGEEPLPEAADHVLQITSSPAGIAAVAVQMGQLPLPKLAAKKIPQANKLAAQMMELSGMDETLKGGQYAKWCMVRMALRSAAAPLCTDWLYRQCAKAHHTSPAAVERSLRWAVEKLFTKGRLSGIEQYFGSGADPERGKPTNRVFLQTAAESLRSILGYGTLGKKQ